MLLLTATLSGCSDGDASSFCTTAEATDVVHAVHGTDLAIDGGDLILHTAASELRLRDGSGCHAITAADVRVGDALAHDADEIAESFPAQAWPDHVVIVRS